MPKRRLDEVLGGPTSAKPKRRRHLYLVLDDWSSGYSIRKIDLSADIDPFNSPAAGATRSRIKRRRLPPAIFRFQAQRGLTRCFAAAFDSILAMLPVCLDPPAGAHAFNVHKRTGRYLPLQAPNPAHPIYIPFDCGALLALADDSFELLRKPCEEYNEDDSSDSEESWKLVWRKLPNIPLPFHSKDVAAYAVHGGEQTLFVSTQDSTFVCYTVDLLMDATSSCFPWERHARHGLWVLPFSGRGHFDSEMQAWIGLSREFAGRLCSCQVFPGYYPPTDEEVVEQSSPAVKISKEELFVLDPREKLVGDATLVSCGVRSYYCLVQCISVSVDEKKLEKQSVCTDELQKQSISVDEKLVEEQCMSVDEKLLEEQSMSVDEKLEEQSISVDKKLEELSVSVDEKLLEERSVC